MGPVADDAGRKPTLTAEIQRLQGEPIAATFGGLESIEGEAFSRGSALHPEQRARGEQRRLGRSG